MERDVFTLKEPLRGLELTFTTLPYDKIVIPNIQREISDNHIKKLMDSIAKLGFIEPIIVIPSDNNNNEYEVINGQHRLKAGRNLGMEEFPVIILPKELKDYIIYLNIEKAPSIRDKAHQSLEIVKKYMNENLDIKENDLYDFIEKGYLITLGIVIEDIGDNKFPASTFEKFLDKFDSELFNLKLSDAYKERVNRAKKLLEAKKVLNERYIKLGLTNPLMKTAIVSKAMQMEYGRNRKTNITDDFYVAIDKLIKNINEVVIYNNNYDEMIE